jgi:hypothetical protein
MKHYHMPGVLIGNLARGWVDKPHLKDPNNWPEEMRREWGDDQGAATGKAAQDHEIEQFRRVRTALDEFNPDLVLMLYRDIAETWRNMARPQYWIHAHDKADAKLFQVFGGRENYHEEDPDRVDTIPGHKEAAMYLARHLQDKGMNPMYCLEPIHQNGLGHNAIAGTVHLDWDRREFKTPIVAMGVDPFGFLRVRNNEGLSAWDRNAPRPLTPQEGFALGQAIAQTFRPSPWKVAIVASTAWSHANNGGLEQERVHQDIEADRRRYEQWRNNEFTRWRDELNFEEMERHAQWELLVSMILGGAMHDLGAKVRYSDFYAKLSLNSTWVTTIFDVK